jgi:hypothetical protein
VLRAPLDRRVVADRREERIANPRVHEELRIPRNKVEEQHSVRANPAGGEMTADRCLTQGRRKGQSNSGWMISSPHTPRQGRGRRGDQRGEEDGGREDRVGVGVGTGRETRGRARSRGDLVVDGWGGEARRGEAGVFGAEGGGEPTGAGGRRARETPAPCHHSEAKRFSCQLQAGVSAQH